MCSPRPPPSYLHVHRLVQNEVSEHLHKDVGGKMTRMTGGVMFYSLTIRIPIDAAVYQLNLGDTEFVRHRRWSSFHELQEKVETILKQNNYTVDIGAQYEGGPYTCPPKSRLFKNKPTVAMKRR